MALMGVANAWFPISDALLQELAKRHSVMQISWARYLFFFLVIMIMVLAWRRERSALRSARLPLHVLRGLVMMSSSIMFVAGLSLMPLADAVAILFLGPLVVVALSGIMLGEKPDWFCWAAVLCGFAGTILIVRPGFGGLGAAALLTIAAAFLWAIQQILARKLSTTERATTGVFYSSLVGFATLTLIVPFQWSTPTALDWGMMFVTGFVAAIGHWGVLKAIELAPISILAPFSYSVMPSAVFIGWAFFDQVPDPVMLLGAAVVCVSGLAVGYRERATRGG